jgi:hypothetical protein
MPPTNYAPDPRPAPPTTILSRGYGPVRRIGGTFFGAVRISTATSPQFTVDNGSATVFSISGGNVTVTPPFSGPAGFILQTVSSDDFAFNIVLQKIGTTGNSAGAVASGAELGNISWRGWTGSAYGIGSTVVVKSDEAFTPTALGAHFEVRLCPIGSNVGTEIMRLRNLAGTGGFWTFGGVTSAVPAIKRSGTDVQFRLADDSLYTNIDALALKVSATKVVGARDAGWVTFTGTANKNAGALDTGTATTAQVAQVVKSLMDMLLTHGLIGP